MPSNSNFKIHCVGGKKKEKEEIFVGFLWPVASGLPVSKLCPRVAKQAATQSVTLGPAGASPGAMVEMQTLRLSTLKAASAFY